MKRKQLRRIEFRKKVFERDGYKCVVCGSTWKLDPHHIMDRNEMPNGGYVVENGITLCWKHHFFAERYHASGKKTWKDGLHPDDLYQMIGSDYNTAYEKSRLKKDEL